MNLHFTHSVTLCVLQHSYRLRISHPMSPWSLAELQAPTLELTAFVYFLNRTQYFLASSNAVHLSFTKALSFPQLEFPNGNPEPTLLWVIIATEITVKMEISTKKRMVSGRCIVRSKWYHGGNGGLRVRFLLMPILNRSGMLSLITSILQILSPILSGGNGFFAMN